MDSPNFRYGSKADILHWFSPEQFAEEIKADIARWATIVKASGIKPE